MTISYRTVTVTVLALQVLLIASAIVLPQKSQHTTVLDADTQTVTFSFDRCGAWEQMALGKRLTVLVWSGSVVFVIVRGLCNRAVSRWFVIMALSTLAVFLRYDNWRVQNCWTALNFISLGSIVLMFAHHLLPRSVAYPTVGSRD